MDIRTVSIQRPDVYDAEEQIDYRGTVLPHGLLIALADGRIITVGPVDGYEDRIVVHGPDMETLLDLPIPTAAQPPVGGIEQFQAEDR